MTLVELLVTLAIIGILVAIMLPAVQQSREAIRRMSCQNNLKQMGLALHSFESVHRRFPKGATEASGWATGGCDPEEAEIEDNPGECTDLQNWVPKCLSFLEASTVADAYDFDRPWSHLTNRAAVSTALNLFLCPSAPGTNRSDQHHVVGAAATDYGAIFQVDRDVYMDLFGVPDPGVAARQGVLAEYESCRPAWITDGLSNTLLLAERAGKGLAYVLGSPMSKAQFLRYPEDDVVEISGEIYVQEGIGWADPDSGFSVEGTGEDGVDLCGPYMINANNIGEAYSFHRGGANFVCADGSVRFLNEQIDVWAYVALCTRGGGEVTQ